MTQKSNLEDCGFICYYCAFALLTLSFFYVMYTADDHKVDTFNWF